MYIQIMIKVSFVQLTSLSKILGHDKAPNLKNLTVLPLRLSPEKDEELLRLTENRIPTFAHDLVPDYLRTKLEPQVEQKMMQLETKAAAVNIDATHVRHHSLHSAFDISHLIYYQTLPSVRTKIIIGFST